MKLSALPTAATIFEQMPKYLRRHKLMKTWMRLTGEDPLQLVRIKDDAFAYADMMDGFLRLVVLEKDYEADFFRVASALLSAGGDFFDVGANYGLLSFGLAGTLSSRVRFHLFEPNPKLISSITKSSALYPSIAVHVNPVAVSDRDGVVLFNIDEYQTGRSHLAVNEGLPVQSVRLDPYLVEHRLDSVALLKLDIEGFELSALRGAEQALRGRLIKAIYFEYFEKNLIRAGTPSQLLEFLQSLEYEVCFCRYCDITNQLLGPTVTIRTGLPGHGLPLVPVADGKLPAMTDLLAVPREHLSPL